MKTYSLKPSAIKRQWYILDASEAPLGRLATTAARLLLGKDKPHQSPHIDGGDFVIIINSDSLVTTGNKSLAKRYYRHSGFPGGLTHKPLGTIRSNNSERVVAHAVRGMLPDNKLRNGRLKRLKIYTSEQHQHHAQTPIALKLSQKKAS